MEHTTNVSSSSGKSLTRGDVGADLDLGFAILVGRVNLPLCQCEFS